MWCMRQSRGGVRPFEDLPLHDSVLHTVRVDWADATCVCEISAFVEPGNEAQPRELVFRCLESLELPRQQPWGPSVFINRALQPSPRTFQLEMQSGDVIEVVAAEVELR